MNETSKEQRIAAELDRISVFFADLAENELAVIAPMLRNAAFMKVTLEDLQEIINRDGVTEIYQNGANQKGVKQSATLQSYNALIKNYAAVTKALLQYLPPERQEKTYPWSKQKTPEELAAERQEQARKAEKARKLLRKHLYPDEYEGEEEDEDPDPGHEGGDPEADPEDEDLE